MGATSKSPPLALISRGWIFTGFAVGHAARFAVEHGGD